MWQSEKRPCGRCDCMLHSASSLTYWQVRKYASICNNTQYVRPPSCTVLSKIMVMKVLMQKVVTCKAAGKRHKPEITWQPGWNKTKHPTAREAVLYSGFCLSPVHESAGENLGGARHFHKMSHKTKACDICACCCAMLM